MTHLSSHTTQYTARNNYGIGAGGVVYKRINTGVQFLLLGRTSANAEVTYHLPKGTLHIDEPIEACALREITEEAGVKVALKTYLGGVCASYDLDGHHYEKIIHYYAAEYVSEADPMDAEHDFKEWCDTTDALEKLSHNPKREDKLIEKCSTYLRSHKKPFTKNKPKH
ncbi:MAG TPA: NUDIX domain-containing protein [Candidatus Saccharibacteria bacterium]|nr:NUDIX domain-containing protein [Candidatus Nomurabacteria bacterium]HPD98832.1 NUDIX domain-containing protein [Candidatus Saccharibacteria bacterium]HPR10313.1 NUDIX domain-containing protein [Candidatus Saccharibacteria bacterium]